MTPQQVIQNFMGKLVDHGQSYSASIGTAMLNSAVQSSSEFSDAQAVIDSMKADQIKAEKQAVEEVLGSSYAGKTMSEVSSSILSASAKTYDTANKGNAYYNSYNDQRTTVERLIKERKATIFLEKYCGIQLANKYWINSSDNVTHWGGATTGNVDTGAISGSDANITLKAGDVLGDATLTAANLQTLKTKYESAASLSSDGQTIIIGTGKEKTDRSIVPEIGNKYTATTSQAQNIKTGSNDWLVVATGGNDTISTGGADSVNAGAGNDKITVGADHATILTGAGSDNVEISAEVKNVTLGDLNSSDILKISGTFEVGSAQIEDTLLVITDKTGTRKIRLGDFDTAKNAKINSTTIGAWLTNAGIDLNNLQTTSSSNEFETSEPTEIGVVNGGEEQIAIDPDYTPTPIQKTRSAEENQDLPQRSSSSTGEINVNLDNVTLTGGDLNLDGSKVGEISNEFPGVNSFTKNGLTINLVGTTSNTNGYPSNFTSKTFDQLTDDEKTIVAGLFKWWGKECLQLNEESYGISFNSSTAQVKEIGLYFYDGNGSSNTLAAVWNWSTNSGQNTTKLMLNVNMDYYKGIAADNFDGESSNSGAGLLDRTLAHEFTHAIMATNLHYFNSLPKFIKEGMAELTHGIDDFRPSKIFQNAYDADWLDASLDLSNTGTGSQSIGDGYSGGYMFLRYLAKQGALQAIANELETVNPLLITLTEGNDSYSNSLAGATILALSGNDDIYNTSLGSNVSIDGGKGNDKIYNGGTWIENGLWTGHNGGSNVTLNAGDGNDSIWNQLGSNSSINAGDGNDFIYNEGSNVTINAGDGDDYIDNSGKNVLFKYTVGYGNDIIKGFNDTSTLKIGNGTTDTYLKSTIGSDVLVSVGIGVITLKDAASLSAVNIAGAEVATVNPNLITLTEEKDYYTNNLDYATILALGDNDKITNYGRYASILGGAGNDFISNGHGDASSGTHVTIVGEEGNDTIGNLAYYYVTLDGGEGNDSIASYNTHNNISISGGAGNDTIDVEFLGKDKNRIVTINGGKGNDRMNLSSREEGIPYSGLIQYTSGDGNDSIIGFNTTSTLKIGNGTTDTYSKSTVGSDILVTVGSGVITLVGAASLSAVNILGKENASVNPLLRTLTENADTYSNTLAGATIQALGGNDRITNTGANVSVDGGAGADYLYSVATKVTLNGGNGNDTLENLDNVSSKANRLVGGAGADSIKNYGNESFVDGGADNDTIYNYGASVSVDGGNDTDYIYSNGTNATILGGTGNDTIDNRGTLNAYIDGGADNDFIKNTANAATIFGGAGNDSINNNKGGSNSSINGGDGADYLKNLSYNSAVTMVGGAGNDTIISPGLNAQLSGGTGNDYISISGSNNLIQYTSGDGNDSVVGFNTTSTLKIGNGTTDTYSKSTIGSDILVSVGSGIITLSGAATLSTVNILGKENSTVNPLLITLTENADTYSNSLANATILALGGNDHITNTGASVSVDLGAGDDYIQSTVASVTINGGAGNDYIYTPNHGSDYGKNSKILGGVGDDTIYNMLIGDVTLDGGAGNDYIISHNNWYNTTSISGGAGNDTIEVYNNGNDTATITGGRGNDLINLGSGAIKDVIEYTSGDGNDSIVGFGTLTTLKIGNGTTDTYSKSTVGSDILVSVGSGVITLKGAASLSAVNIVGMYVPSNGKLSFGDGYVEYIVADEVIFTIYGISSAATLSDFTISGNVVTISKNALGEDDVFLEGEGYTLKLANDVPQSPTTTNGGWSSLVNGKATYTAASKSAYYTLEDNTVTYTPAEGGEQFTLSGVKSIASTAVQVDDEDKVVILFKAALGTGTITLDGDDYSLALDESIIQDPGNAERKFTSLTNGTATYKIFGDRAYYTLDGNEVFYTGATSDKTFTISGLANNLTLKNGAISGISAVVNEEDKTVKFTLAAAALKDSDVTLSGTGATLELASDVPQTAKDIPEAWSEVAGGTASYSTNGKTKYYTLANGKVTYHAPIAGDLQIKLSGLSTTAQTVDGKIDGLTVSGKSLTIGAAAVGKNVSLQYNNGFDVNLASDVKNISFVGTSGVDSITNNGDNVTINSGAGKDRIVNKGASVSLIGGEGNDSIFNGTVFGNSSNYHPTVGTRSSINGDAGNDTIYNTADSVTIDGGSGSDYIYNWGNYASSVSISGGEGSDTIYSWGNSKQVTISGGSDADYIYSRGTNNVIDGGTGNDTVYNYGSNVTIDGGAGNDTVYNYVASDVTINTAQGNDIIKLGASVKSFMAEGFSAGDAIQLYSSATKLETISGGIKVGNVSISGVEGIATVNNSWSTSTNSIAYNQSTVAGAKLSGKTITYDATSGTENLFTISGIKSTTGVALSGKEITLNNAALKNVTGTVSISGGDYKLKLASDVDTIAEDNAGWTTLTGGNVAYLEGGKGSYYSLSSDGKSVTYNAAVAGTNRVEFGGVKGTPTISGNTVSLTANNFNGNVSVASNAGNYQFALSGAFGGKKFTGTAKTDKISNSGSNISIDGGAGNDTFTNSGANVTLTGGKGNDVFAYSKGSFKITDYTASADKISLDIAGVQDVALSNKDVTLKLGQSDAVTIVGGKDKKITVAKTKTAQYIFGDHVIFNTGKTSASLTTAATKFDATSYSAMVTVDGVKTNSAVQIVGNAKANKIYAGAKGSTLNGGKGNDTLYGGAGVDIFVYANKTGNDVIQNYTSGKDKISLGAGASVAGFSVNTSGDAVLKIGSNNLTIKKADNENISTNGKKITIIDSAGNETTSTYFTNRTVSGKGVTLNADYANTFTASSAIVSVDATQNSNSLVINGNSKNNVLSGGTGNDKLLGSSGNDTLSGGDGNDTLTGGAGNDLFVYTSGKDVIADYVAGDKISISAAISKSTLKGSDAVFSIGSGTLTVKKGKGKELVFVDAKGTARTIIGGAQLITNSTAAKPTLASGVAVADASERTKAINITGNASANTILGGSGSDILYGGKGNDSLVGGKGNDKLYGQAGNDSLWGGAGNDSLYGSSGNDTFIYKPNEGTDKIFDYQSGDILQILKADGTAGGSFKSSKFSGGALTLTINGGGTVIFDGVAKEDKFNINGKTYTISGSKLK